MFYGIPQTPSSLGLSHFNAFNVCLYPEKESEMQVSKAVDEFMFSLVNKSRHTKRAYKYALNLFASWCHDHDVELETIKAGEVRRHTEWLLSVRKLSINVVHNNVITIKTFLKWCVKEEDLFEAVPTEKTLRRIEIPRQDMKVIETFTTDQFKRLLAACSESRFAGHEARNKAILSVLLDTGIRAEELCNLKVEDVFFHEDDCFIRIVNGKGRRSREVGFGVQTRKVLRAYILRYRKASDNERALFISRKGGHLGPLALNDIIKTLAEIAGINGVRYSAHTFRFRRLPPPLLPLLLPPLLHRLYRQRRAGLGVERNRNLDDTQPGSLRDSQKSKPRREPPSRRASHQIRS